MWYSQGTGSSELTNGTVVIFPAEPLCSWQDRLVSSMPGDYQTTPGSSGR